MFLWLVIKSEFCILAVRKSTMKIFKKLVGIDPVDLQPEAEERLKEFADSVQLYRDIPQSTDEMVQRISDADAVLLNYTSYLGKEVIRRCPQLRYIGMCNSLYSVESANVDIRYAEKKGIRVKGIRDYGDEGVVEFVISKLIYALQGFGNDAKNGQALPWNGIPEEITGLKCGILGLGKTGGMIAEALQFFGAEVSYFSRTRKPDQEEKGWSYKNLNELLQESQVVCCCLNRHVTLLYEEEFKQLGNHKILFNTGLSPVWDKKAFLKWLQEDNLFIGDSLEALGDQALLNHPHVRCENRSVGRTRQAYKRLSQKVLDNLVAFSNEQGTFKR